MAMSPIVSAFGAALLIATVGAGCRNEDRQLETRVRAELAADPEGSGIAVSVDDRVVRLVGVVDAPAESTRLENRVAHVDGVLAVRNELVVAPPVETTSGMTDVDRAVAASVAAQLAAAGFGALEVSVTDGAVLVRGKVAPSRHDEALEVARRAAPAFRIEDRTTLE